MQNADSPISNHTPAYVCSHVFANTKPVLLVCKEEGDWQFLCGGGHAEQDLPKVVGIHHLLERDHSLYSILDLENNWEAERLSPDDDWVRKKIDS